MTPRREASPRAGAVVDDSFKEYAACLGVPSDVFFPPKGQGLAKDAIEICAGCPVSAECLDYALDINAKYGIWAGLNEKQRRRIRKERRNVE